MDGGSVIGQISTIGDSIWVDGRWQRCNWLVDLMVSPEHRGKTTGIDLFKRVMEVNPVSVSLGVDPNVLGLYKMFRWRRLPMMKTFFSVIRPSPLATLATLAEAESSRIMWTRPLLRLGDGLGPPLQTLRSRLERATHRKLAIEPLSHFDAELDSFLRQTLARWKHTSYRSSQHLEWKFNRRPYGRHFGLAARERRSGELRGYVVVKLMERSGVARWADVADFVVAPGDRDAFRALVSATYGEALRWKVDFVRLCCSHSEHVAQLRPPVWIHHGRAVLDDLFVYSKDADLVCSLITGPWHLTAVVSDRLDHGSDEWENGANSATTTTPPAQAATEVAQHS